MTDTWCPLIPAEYTTYIERLRSELKRQYDRGVNRDLSRQNCQSLFRRNVIAVLAECYQDALKELQLLTGAESESLANVSAQEVLPFFDGMVEELIQYALQKHRTSCALSNFPSEHGPSAEYLDEVIQASAADWSMFVSQVHVLMA